MGKGMRAGKKPKAPGAGNMQKQLQQMQAMAAPDGADAGRA